MNTTHLHPADLVIQLRILQANHDALKYHYDRQAKRLDDVEATAHRLALELECLFLDCKNNVVVSRWMDTACEALDAWRALNEQPYVSAFGKD